MAHSIEVLATNTNRSSIKHHQLAYKNTYRYSTRFIVPGLYILKKRYLFQFILGNASRVINSHCQLIQTYLKQFENPRATKMNAASTTPMQLKQPFNLYTETRIFLI